MTQLLTLTKLLFICWFLHFWVSKIVQDFLKVKRYKRRKPLVRLEILRIEADLYNSYNGRAWKPLEKINTLLQYKIGDYKFLAYLQKARVINPKPVYSLPKQRFISINLLAELI